MSQNTAKFNLKATLSLATALLFWSSIPLFLRSFIDEIDPWVANGTRYPLSALLWLFPVLWMVRKGIAKPIHFKLAIIPTIVNVFAQIFLAWAPYHIEPGMMMFLGRISILFSITASMIIFMDERKLTSSMLFWFGLFICVIGFSGLNLTKETFSAESTWFGVCLITLHALFIAFYSVAVRYYLRGVNPWISFPIVCQYTAVILFILMWFIGEPARLLDMSIGRLSVLAFSSVIGIALGHVFFYYALEHLGVSISSSSGLIMPFLTSIGSYFIFNETFSFGQLIFGIVLLLGGGLLLYAQQHLGERHSPVVSSPYPELEEFASVDED